MLYILKIPTKFGVALRKVFVKIKILFRIRIRIMILYIHTYISYIEDTHQILFGSANFFESYCVHSQNPRTYSQTTRQTDRRKFFLLVLCSKHIQNMIIHQKKIFFFTHAITIFSLFTYFICDEKVKILFCSTNIFQNSFFSGSGSGFYHEIQYQKLCFVC